MTSYHGGKQHCGPEIASIILQILNIFNIEISGYCEPFCGMLGVYKHIIPSLPSNIKFLAGDQNKSLILMWKSIQSGWKPSKNISLSKYLSLKYNNKSSPTKGFVGHHYSFGGKYFQGYVYKNPDKVIKKLSSFTDIKNFNKIKFKNSYYTSFSHLKNFLIYCDPPYSIYSKYYNDNNSQLKFNSDEFWDWVRYMSKHNIVLVSEYSAPKDFFRIKICKKIISYGNSSPKFNTEYLFIYKPLLENL